MSKTAKIFKNGHSQAVRLPKEYRLPGDEVKITRLGTGILLQPIEQDFSCLAEAINQFSDDFMEQGREQPQSQEREEFFK